MSPLAISGIVFGCIFLGTLLGKVLHTVLPKHHLNAESKDVVKLAMGLIGTMTALVLGLLIASAKSSFDTQRSGLNKMAGNVVFLDRTLANYGPEAKDARVLLKAVVVEALENAWPEERSQAKHPEAKAHIVDKGEELYQKIQALAPNDNGQRYLQDQALKTYIDIGQMRWSLFAQKGSSIPMAFLVVMVCWLTLILAGFSLLSPPNATAFIALLICTLAVSSAVFLILELDRPFNGMIQISSDSLRSALAQLGR